MFLLNIILDVSFQFTTFEMKFEAGVGEEFSISIVQLKLSRTSGLEIEYKCKKYLSKYLYLS